MSIQPRTHETVSEVQSTDPRDDYIPVGVDKTGAHHVYRTTDETVHVIDGGERTHREDLEAVGQTINAWIDYVDHERDWASQQLYKTMGDSLTDAVEVSD